jgi:purine-binding chemotaxis protein CheW
MTRQLCTFALGDLWCGIDVLTVQEVLRYQRPTRTPLADPAVRGLINLRGQIVTAIDLRRRLGLPDAPADHRPMSLVVQTADGPVALLVDDIGDVLDADEDGFERPPETLVGPTRAVVRGVYKLPDRLLLSLDTNELLTVSR